MTCLPQHKTTPSMPSLPLELWRIILRELTYEPHVLATYSEPYAKDFSDYCLEDTRAWRQNKCRAVLVCKTWRQLALPFLYEVVILQDEVQAQKVLEVVAAERPDADGGRRGAFVRQILIREKLGEVATILHDVWASSLVSRIASCCPRMAIFSCRLRMAPHQAICFYVLLGSLRDARSLRKLDFGSGVVQSAYGMAEILSKAVAALPYLETLVVPRFTDWECRQDELLRLLAMPEIPMRAAHLRTLVVSWQGYVFISHRATPSDVPFSGTNCLHGETC
ncbi:hypothetical protein DENSPDRAFT_837733 [Dentipellis sp. KUC8613]|nr:hypothetical protein DENSPDRAFT_837733 [Dentipellis sp. KUC8613]